ncbi:GumC family protein [Paucibacter sp. XJ19-41]|uniref:GumC family protein n=1 Tax=Paucibacter sp. XJ19-41 TaxID=2927824 RepID=UPI0023492DD2|nr:hypothetical protein [Paucibacter sp. XJ19-41]MDC6166938.1 hypothetical protein [Paucibacter sp. XJ19-41]
MFDRTSPPPELYPPQFGPAQAIGPGAEPQGRSPAMRRRIQVFLGVFLLALLIGQGANLLRTPIYRAQALLEITPASATAMPEAPEVRQAMLREAELLGSRPLLEKTLSRLLPQGFFTQATPDAAVSAMRDMLTISEKPGSQLLQIEALAADAVLAARLVNTLVEVYREEQGQLGQVVSAAQLSGAREALRVIGERVEDKRRLLEDYRQRSQLPSNERDEIPALSRLKGLNQSLSSATEREASAAGRVRAIEQALAEGRPVPQAGNRPGVAAIEQRLALQQEELRALERQFTPQYLAMDPGARALKTRIADLQQQLEAELARAQQTALAEAREELASSSAAAERLRRQLAGDQKQAQAVNTQLATVQAMAAELDGLLQMQQESQQQLLALEATQTSRQPQLRVLEAAALSESPWHPHYGRDAAIMLAIALLLGFLAVWFVEFFNRAALAAPASSTVVLNQPWMGLTPARPPQPLENNPQPPALERGHAFTLPRELAPHEVAGLLENASTEQRALLSALLTGLSSAETAALQLVHIELDADLLHVPGEQGRSLPLPTQLRQFAQERRAAADAPSAAGHEALFMTPEGWPLGAAAIEAAAIAAAHDAQLARPQTVTADCLRHSYIAFIVRQGLRFAELPQVVGRLSPELLNALSELLPDGRRVPLEAIERLMPQVRPRQLA